MGVEFKFYYDYDFLPNYGIIGPARAYRASNPVVSTITKGIPHPDGGRPARRGAHQDGYATGQSRTKKVSSLVDRAKNIFLSSGGRHDLDLDLALDLPPIMADRSRIVQVLSNLLSNAARHSLESSVIRVTALREYPCWV